MKHTFSNLTVDISSLNTKELLQNWEWLIGNNYQLILITLLGDAFIAQQDSSIYWLQTDIGEISKVAPDLNSFNVDLTKEENIDLFFLPQLIDTLQNDKKTLQQNEVYSFLKFPVLGGEYSSANIVAKNINEHFAFTGYFFNEIKDLPDGTEVKFEVTE